MGIPKTAGEELDAWLRSLPDQELLSLLERVSEELKGRNTILGALGGKTREEAVQGIADALLADVRR